MFAKMNVQYAHSLWLCWCSLPPQQSASVNIQRKKRQLSSYSQVLQEDFSILFEILYLFAFFLSYFCLKNKLAYIKEYYLKVVLFAVSKYLTLLIEIHPINNVRVLKAVDSCVRVQVKYPSNLKINLFNLLC